MVWAVDRAVSAVVGDGDDNYDDGVPKMLHNEPKHHNNCSALSMRMMLFQLPLNQKETKVVISYIVA